MQGKDISQTRILVIGAGAVGGYYGAMLARQGAQVAIVCRSDAPAVRAAGYHIQSPQGDFVFQPEQVLTHPAEYAGHLDYLLLTVKVLDDLDRAELIRPVVGPDTVIVLLENGIEIEAPIAQSFPNNEIISALAFIAVSRTAPGHIHHQAYGYLNLGNYPRGLSPRAQALAQGFQSAGVACTATEDVVTARWQKGVWNAAFNPISALAGGASTGQILAAPAGAAVVRAAMEEVCAIASACGHPLPPHTVSKNLEETRAMPAYLTSMALDYLHGREMEVEAILGNAVRAAQREGVAVPTLETLYGLMKITQGRMAAKL